MQHGVRYITRQTGTEMFCENIAGRTRGYCVKFAACRTYSLLQRPVASQYLRTDMISTYFTKTIDSYISQLHVQRSRNATCCTSPFQSATPMQRADRASLTFYSTSILPLISTSVLQNDYTNRRWLATTYTYSHGTERNLQSKLVNIRRKKPPIPIGNITYFHPTLHQQCRR